MSDLETRLREASGPERVTDALGMRLLSGIGTGKKATHWYQACNGKLITDDLAPKLTASVDACGELARHLGFWWWDIYQRDLSTVRIYVAKTGDESDGKASHRHVPNAFLIALLRALRARTSSEKPNV